MNAFTNTRRPQQFATTVLMATIVLMGGCSRLSTDYGQSKGSGKKSLNGFGALRAAYENAGFRDRDVSRLSERVSQADVIVWTPQTLKPIDTSATRWFEGWLRRGNRTLVYIVPDSGSETDYWMDAGSMAPPAQRLEYRKRAAKSVNERMVWRLNRQPIPSNGWFRVEPTDDRQRLGKTTGDWRAEVLGADGEPVDLGSEFRVVAFDPNPPTATPSGTTPPGTAPATTAPAATPPARGGPTGPTGPGPTGWAFGDETIPTKTETTFEPLLISHAGDAVVAEITSPRWRNSKIIVVTGGSMLTNYAFTRPFSRNLADKIVTVSTPSGKQEPMAGFLTSGWNSIPVSDRKKGVPEASGWSLLTQWPISIVTIHGFILGLVVCLMLLPIFGRPRHVKPTLQSNFGDHLDAVAALMMRTGGERFARARISEYMKRMHKETSGPWVLPDPPATKPPPLSPPKVAPKQQPASPQPTMPPSDAPVSLLEQALAEEPNAEKPVSPNRPAPVTASGPPIPVAGPNTASIPAADGTSHWSACEEIFATRLANDFGLQPTTIPNGVSIPGLTIKRSEGNLVRLSDSAALCVLVVSSKLDSAAGGADFREILSYSGSTQAESIRAAAEAYMEVFFPAIHALVAPVAPAQVIPIPGWDVFTGIRPLRQDDGWLGQRLGARSALDWLPDTIAQLTRDPGVHRLSIAVSHGTPQRLQVECYIDGARSSAAEQELQREMAREGAIAGVWQLRQFFTMRPQNQN